MPAPRLLDLRVGNGGKPFAGDRRLLTTVSPNGDGLRDRAIVSFRLDRAAKVTLEAVRTDAVGKAWPAEQTVWSRTASFGSGRHHLTWPPSPKISDRTYVLRLTLVDRRGRRRVYGNYKPSPHTRANAPVVRILGVQAGFLRRSYAPGERADVIVSTDARAIKVQVFAYGQVAHPTEHDLKTGGIAVTPPIRLDWRGRQNAPHRLRVVRVGAWASGLYFLRATANDGRVGYAPFILRASPAGRPRVAVVLATNTWQAYNFEDANGDGWGDSWYVSPAIRSVDLRRPFLDFGVPYRFRDWDLSFVAWLNRTKKHVDFLSDDDLEQFRSGDELAARYDLVVFPGHEEYVTRHAYDVVQRYRDLGGNLAFLSSNNFFAKVVLRRHRLRKVQLWRKLGRPEAGLVGVQYDGGDYGQRQGSYVVTGAAREPWLFAGTGLQDGDRFGRYGIEIDKRTSKSPPGTVLLAAIPNLLGLGRSAEMTYYETPAGAKVFAAGTLNFAASSDEPAVSRLLENLWARLSKP